MLGIIGICRAIHGNSTGILLIKIWRSGQVRINWTKRSFEYRSTPPSRSNPFTENINRFRNFPLPRHVTSSSPSSSSSRTPEILFKTLIATSSDRVVNKRRFHWRDNLSATLVITDSTRRECSNACFHEEGGEERKRFKKKITIVHRSSYKSHVRSDVLKFIDRAFHLRSHVSVRSYTTIISL